MYLAYEKGFLHIFLIQNVPTLFVKSIINAVKSAYSALQFTNVSPQNLPGFPGQNLPLHKNPSPNKADIPTQRLPLQVCLPVIANRFDYRSIYRDGEQITKYAKSTTNITSLSVAAYCSSLFYFI